MPKPPFFVFVHDLGQTPLQWEDVVIALPPGVGAACPWLRGTRPGGAAVPFRPADAAASLLTALDENGAETGTLVGVGVGASIALRCAAEVPDRVDAVIAVSTPLHPTRRQLAAQRTAVRLMPRRALAARNVDKDRLMAALHGLAEDAQAMPLEAVRAPVTLVVGAGDRAGLVAARSLAATLPQAVIRELPGVSGDLPRVAAAPLAELVFAGVPSLDALEPWDLS
jgi:3-oxoadipate enol-lactonase